MFGCFFSNIIGRIVLFIISFFNITHHDGLYFKLNDGNKIPAVGYGTWMSSGEDLEKALHTALDVGYRHIDTATAYGNEEIIGKVLQEWFSAGKLTREEIFITTKLPFNAMRPQSVEEYIKDSLRKLQLDYVDMYLLHGPIGFAKGDVMMPKDANGNYLFEYYDHLDIWKVMEAQVDAGRTKSIGVSNFNEKQIKRIINNCRIPPSNLQVEMHLYFQQKSLRKFCEDNNIVPTSYSTLGGSATGRQRFGIQNQGILEHPVVVKIAKKYDKTPAQIVLRFFIQTKIVVIPKSLNEKRIAENHELYDFKISKQDMEELESIDQGEDGRIFVFQHMFPGIEKHPEYPFPLRSDSDPKSS